MHHTPARPRHAIVAIATLSLAGPAPAQSFLLNSFDSDLPFQLGGSFPSGVNSSAATTDGPFPFFESEIDDPNLNIAGNDDEVTLAGAIPFFDVGEDTFVETLNNNLNKLGPFAVFAYTAAQGSEADELNASSFNAANTTLLSLGLGAIDPFLAHRIRVTNPLDVTVVYRLETTLDIDTLDGFTAVAAGRFSAEVFDTGGDPGAELEFSIGYTLRQVTSGDELSAPIGHSGTIIEGAASTRDTGPNNLTNSEDFDRILSSTFLTLSPGDTAVITSIGDFGDATLPLTGLDAIEPNLAVIETGFENFFAVPEPGVGAMIGGAGALAARRRRK